MKLAHFASTRVALVIALAAALVMGLAVVPAAGVEPAPTKTIERVKPTISGVPVVGETLEAKQKQSKPKASATYQWLRDKEPISGATKSSYKLTSADVGTSISVRVRLSAAEHKPSSNTSKQLGPVIKRHSLTEPSSIWVVVNKKHPLTEKKYVPKTTKVKGVPGGSSHRLRGPAASALRSMYKAAKKDGKHFAVTSSYRSYDTQKNLFNRYVRTHGRASAERFSARPGHSEHQLGLAVDIYDSSKCRLKACYGSSASGKWVAKNAHKYGFIIRYPKNKEKVTGYKYEPWHLRYVGVELATAMKTAKVQTLEEYFSLGNAAKY